jgi:hypothetical protein
MFVQILPVSSNDTSWLTSAGLFFSDADWARGYQI